MKHIFIVNPAAGKRDATDYVTEKVLESGIENYLIYRTKNVGDATEYIKKYLSENKGEVRFYSCGGDGTLNEVANGAAGYSNASVTVFPCGSGNDFLKYYGSAEDFSDIKALSEGVNHKIDLLKVCGKYAVNAVHFGLDTHVLKTMHKVRRYFLLGGRNSYTTGIISAFLNGMRTKCHIENEGEVIAEDEILLCTLCNGKFVGGGYKCAPRSLDDDGLMELCAVAPVGRIKFLTLMGTYKKGKHLEDKRFAPYTTYKRCKKIEITGDKNFFLSIDGELQYTEKCIVEVEKGALNFAVPQALANQLNLLNTITV